jgi:site-specific recombinase XerD
VAWIRRFIVFHDKRHPRELGEREVTAFISSLAVRGVSASTQNQALSAILFLFEIVMGQRLPWMEEIVRAQRPIRLPVVLSRDEVSGLLSHLHGSRVANGFAHVRRGAEAARMRRASRQGH